MTSEPSANTTSAITSTGSRPRRSAIRPMSGSIATYPSRKPDTIGAAFWSCDDLDADAGHHVGQREHHDVGVGGREGDRDGGEAEQEPLDLVQSPAPTRGLTAW